MTGTSWDSADIIHGAITASHTPVDVQLINGSSRYVYINFNASNSCDRYSDTATEVNPLYQSCLFYVRY